MIQSVVINNDNIIEQLKWLLANPETIDNSHLEIGDIAPIEIKLIGNVFHNSLTSTIMRGLLELQESIYRSYAIAKNGDDNLSNLTSYEKERLELIITIRPGCTEIIADIRGLIQDFKDLLADMTPKQKLAVIGLVLLTVFGCYAVTQLKDYHIEKDKNQTQIQLQKDENATKIELEKQKTEQFKSIEESIIKSFEKGIESQQKNNDENVDKPNIKSEISQHPTENYFTIIQPTPHQTQEIIDKVREQYPVADRVTTTMSKGLEKLIHSTHQADYVNYNNVMAMSGDVAKNIKFETRAVSQLIVFNEKFRILDLDSKRTDIRRTRLRNSDGLEFSAEFKDSSIGKSKMDKLLQAFKGYHPVELAIEAKQLKGKIHSAIITQVREVDTSFSYKKEEEHT